MLLKSISEKTLILYKKMLINDKCWLFGMDRDAVADLLGVYGWRVLEHLGYEEFAVVIQKAQSIKRPVHSLYLFCNRRGQKYTYDGFASLWRRVVEKSGVDDVHFHDIRAKSLTDAQRQGRDAQMLGGHETRSMTDHYIKQRRVEKVQPLRKIEQKE